ncbi:acyltransferase ChoActase/COT/CPT [Thelephora terrestris]|uniref:Acyltransferase ChoActase/COT/CPT n=1 Tax=Thelephora terrestris TaxID=56493 RepID=A0A9P6L644_9AGAM|nr:acyltransferase ChoActase/COT/CPT [Thelephora terrestris]
MPPPNWKAKAPLSLPGPTFAAQAKLQKLPVPELEQTFRKLRESLKPIAHSREEYDATVAKVDDFARGLAPKLHERLLRRRDETDHWLEEWWDNDAYLAYRDSVVVNVSYFYGFEDQPSHLPQTQASRAANLIRATMLFRKKFKLGQVPPEGPKGDPWCMDTWRWMFDCCRIPGTDGKDWSVSYAKEGDTGDTGHVVLIRKGRFWRLDPFKDGKLLSSQDLERQIRYVLDSTTHEYPAIGTLTASNRDVWARDYDHLRSDPYNANIIDDIHSSAFIVCLDTEKPSNVIEFSRSLWHGAITLTDEGVQLGLRNRWVDKPVQLIVFDNAKAGLMGEHSVMDGTPTVTMCDQAVRMIKDPSFDHGVEISSAVPVALDFRVTPQTEQAIKAATVAAFELVDSQAMSFHLTKYGKAAIKRFQTSPDSWAQMTIQLAYARLLESLGQKRQGGTYESATTRKFYKGRTEVIRTVSSESDAFVESMLDPHAPWSERKDLFREAAKKHIETAKAAGSAQGIDRHLLGLKKMMEKNEVGTVAMFDDPVFKRSQHWALSTSAVFSGIFEAYGWGEVVPDGFGVAYMTGFDDRLMYTITSRKEMPNKQFCEEIARAAEDLYELFMVEDAKM